MCTEGCNTKCKKCSDTCSIKKEPVVVPVIIDADDVYYNPDNTEPSQLESVKVGNGRTVKYALEQIVKHFNLSEGLGYSLFDLSCFDECEIEDAQQFAETIAAEVCQIKEALLVINNSITELNKLDSRIKLLELPKIKNGNLLGIKEGDGLETILNILVDRYNTLPSFNQTYYKFEIKNTGNNTVDVTYFNSSSQLSSISIPAFGTVEIENVKSILTSSTNTLTFIFKGI